MKSIVEEEAPFPNLPMARRRKNSSDYFYPAMASGLSVFAGRTSTASLLVES